MRPPRSLVLRLTAAAIAAAVLSPALARAQTLVGVPAPPAIDPGIADDPNGDRAMIMPTALTQPRGTLTVSDYDIFLAGLTYGITDHLQIGLSTLVVGGGPLSPDAAVIGAAKWQFLRAGNLRLAALGGLMYAAQEQYAVPGEGDNTVTRHVRPQLGLIGSLCLTDDCRSLISASVLSSIYREGGSLHGGRVLYSAAATIALWRHLKLLAEYDQDAQIIGGHKDLSPPVVSLGLRLHGRYLAAEAGAMIIKNSANISYPLPFLSATFRL